MIRLRIIHMENSGVVLVATVALIALAWAWVKLGEYAANESPSIPEVHT